MLQDGILHIPGTAIDGHEDGAWSQHLAAPECLRPLSENRGQAVPYVHFAASIAYPVLSAVTP